MGLQALQVFALTYLATPYSKYKNLDVAADEACRITAALSEFGVHTYSPIVYTHQLTRFSAIDPRNHDFWLWVDAPFMDAAEALIVAHMPGWDDSFGIKQEIAEFERHHKPIFHLDPKTMELLDG